MKKLINLISLSLALVMFLSACGGSSNTAKKSVDPYEDEDIKKLSEITTATDPDYADALVSEMSLYADNLVSTGDIKYTEKEDLADISEQFPDGKTKSYSYKEFDVYTGNGFVKSGASEVNDSWIPYTAADSKVVRIDFGKDFEIESVVIKWSGTKSAKGRIQVSDDDDSWYNAGEQFVLNKTKNEITVDVNETHRRYLRLYFPTDIDITQVTDVTINGCESNATTKTPTGAETNGVERPTIFPVADSVEGVKKPVISLAGTWKYTAEPQSKFWENDADLSDWTDVTVPGDPDNLNVGVRTVNNNSLKENIPTAFKIRTTIPKDYSGKEVLLHFDGITYYSRIFVNGQLVRTHRNATTAFDCIVTDYVEPGKDAIITVEATYEIFCAESGLFQGIIGYPKLMAVPKESICRLQYETDLDSTYTNATLNVTSSAFSNSEVGGSLKIELTDPDGNPVKLDNDTAAYNGVCTDISLSNEISSVQTYDCEHPRLYTLTAYMMSADGKETECIVKKVGFKEIEKSGNKILVNGQETKLRGVDWNNLSPTNGLVADYWSDRASLIKLAAANINYIRTSHHPQYSYVFDICDELGIYVEEECGIAMVCQWNECIYERYEKLCNPDESEWYLNYYAEMVEGSRSRASLLFYSLGNESDWGANIQAGHDYILAVDGKHPTKFSWGKLQPSNTSTEIFSVHYPSIAELYYNPSTEVPYIYDEYAHVLGHVPSAYYEDPSINTHWDLEKLWELIYNQDGALGGAVWAGRDMATLTPDGGEKYFVRQWGILDTWNREKEEYWILKKAYSPVQIDESVTYSAPAAGSPLVFEVENRYRYTNLKDLTVECTVNGTKVDVTMPDIAVKSKGNISISYDNWQKGDVVKLVFRNNTGALPNYIVDDYEFVLGGKTAPEFAAATGDAPTVSETDSAITVSGSSFEINLDKTTGKITDGKYNGLTTIIGGPEINLGRMISLTNWQLGSVSSKTEGSEAIVTVTGAYKQVSNVVFNIKIDSTGRIDTQFSVDLPGGSIEEIGVTYKLKELKEISWDSDTSKYSIWPQASVARLSGTAVPYRKSETVSSILEKPTWNRNMDTVTFGIIDDGTRLTSDFRARRRNLFYEQIVSTDDIVLAFESDGKGCARIASSGDKDKSVNLMLGCVWGHIDPTGEFAAQYADPLEQTTGNYSGNIVLRLSDKKFYD